MRRLALKHWAAWATSVSRPEEWNAWARAPRALPGSEAPEVRFLPPLQRRRCDLLSRAMLEVAHACCPEDLRDRVACVFASRHGPFATTATLLQDLASNAALSPTRFSHSVHNAPAGLFSIWARNPNPASAVVAGAETFAHGFLEAVAMLHRERERPVLFVSAEETPPQPFDTISDRIDGAHAVAVLLEQGEGFELRLEEASDPPSTTPWPDALEFLRWWLTGEPLLRLTRGRRSWVWTRDG